MPATTRPRARPRANESSRRIWPRPAGLRPDTDSHERLVEQYLPLADKLARRYRHSSEPLDDLVQVARLGLLKAARRWEPDRGLAFSTYAVPTILGELRRHFRDRAWTVRPPRDLQELFLSIQHARDQLWQALGREPSANDVAAHLDEPVEAILDALQAASGLTPESLDVPLYDEDRDGATRQDLVADPRLDYRHSEARITLEQLGIALDAREREVLRLRLEEDLTQAEIGERIGCSQMHVSRILRGAFSRLEATAG